MSLPTQLCNIRAAAAAKKIIRIVFYRVYHLFDDNSNLGVAYLCKTDVLTSISQTNIVIGLKEPLPCIT